MSNFNDSFLDWIEKLPKDERELPSTQKTEEEIKAYSVVGVYTLFLAPPFGSVN
jgi:hypothetical protein